MTTPLGEGARPDSPERILEGGGWGAILDDATERFLGHVAFKHFGAQSWPAPGLTRTEVRWAMQQAMKPVRALLSARVGAVTPEIDLWRLTWLLRDVADRLPMTDVGRERYVELRGFAEQIERVRARLASPEPSKGVSSPLI